MMAGLPHAPTMRRRMSSGRCDFLMCSTSHCRGVEGKQAKGLMAG